MKLRKAEERSVRKIGNRCRTSRLKGNGVGALTNYSQQVSQRSSSTYPWSYIRATRKNAMLKSNRRKRIGFWVKWVQAAPQFHFTYEST